MSRINLDFSVFTDVRFKLLAKSTNLSLFDVIGRCARIWIECTHQESYSLTENEVDLLTDYMGFNSKLIASGLASRRKNRTYIKGTSGRIEWLAKLRLNAKKGGQARAKTASRDSQARFQAKPSHQAGEHASPPTPTPTPIHTNPPLTPPLKRGWVNPAQDRLRNNLEVAHRLMDKDASDGKK